MQDKKKTSHKGWSQRAVIISQKVLILQNALPSRIQAIKFKEQISGYGRRKPEKLKFNGQKLTTHQLISSFSSIESTSSKNPLAIISQIRILFKFFESKKKKNLSSTVIK
jgi:hypothetical protein